MKLLERAVVVVVVVLMSPIALGCTDRADITETFARRISVGGFDKVAVGQFAPNSSFVARFLPQNSSVKRPSSMDDLRLTGVDGLRLVDPLEVTERECDGRTVTVAAWEFGSNNACADSTSSTPTARIDSVSGAVQLDGMTCQMTVSVGDPVELGIARSEADVRDSAWALRLYLSSCRET